MKFDHDQSSTQLIQFVFITEEKQIYLLFAGGVQLLYQRRQKKRLIQKQDSRNFYKDYIIICTFPLFCQIEQGKS